MAKPRWATVLAGVLRPLALVLGATYAVHRLSLRLVQGADGTAEPVDIGPFPRRLVEALTPDRAVADALGRTAILAGSGLLIGLFLGWLAWKIRGRIGRGRATDRPTSGRWSGLAIAMTVPGLIWLPLQAFVVDQGLVPADASGPLDADLGPARSIGLWALLIGLALAPTVAVARAGGRSWSAGGSGGHPALGSLAARPSSGPVWRVGFPTVTFGATLAVAEVVASTGGLIDRFVDALVDGRADVLLELATPVIVAGALLVPATDIGAAVLRRVERPHVPGSDLVRPGPGPAMIAIALGALVLAAVFGGLAANPNVASTGPALADPSFGGPWLGADALGRSVAARTGSALAISLAGSALPALVAVTVGAGIAFLRRGAAPTTQTVVDAVLDLVSWPAMLVVPLAAWPVVEDERSILHPLVIGVTGLLLAPMATRLLIRPVTGAERMARLVAAALLLTALALVIHLVAGFIIPPGDPDWPGLGTLIASGADVYGDSPWPLISALAAASAAGTALYWSVGVAIRVGRARPAATVDDTAGWSTARPDRSVLAPDPDPDSDVEPDVESGPDLDLGETPILDDRPARITLSDDHAATIAAMDQPPIDGLEQLDESEPLDVTEQFEAGRSDVTEQANAAEQAQWSAEAEDRDAIGEFEPAPDDDLVDIREDITVDSVVDLPPPDEPDITRSIEDEASQTVELRPADLRRAGVQPDPD